MKLRKIGIVASVALAAAALAVGVQAQQADMSFFVSSIGSPKGADFGGLAGADKHCQTLAAAVGAGGKTWHAYLSTQASALNDPKFVNARDRIGSGPWQNAKGVVVARNVEELHSAANNVTKQTVMDEKGQPVNSRTEKPNKHDILTGSRPDGTAFPGAPFPDMTCGNWTKGGTDGSSMLGHFDRAGPIDAPWVARAHCSWRSHRSSSLTRART